MGVSKARALQERIGRVVVAQGEVSRLRWAAGCDVAYEKGGDRAVACAVLWDVSNGSAAKYSLMQGKVSFPYVPGLLAFREAPLILEAIGDLSIRPDVILVDGHGIAHPSRAGLACHVGLFSGIPTVGCAKRLLVGVHEPVQDKRGAFAWLWHREQRVGAAIRSRKGAKPVYVSPGHGIGLEGALKVVLLCLGRYRLPEPVRQAHLRAEALKRTWVKNPS